MSLIKTSPSVPSRRDLFRMAAAAGAGGLVPMRGASAAVTLTLMHESSFIQAFDAYMQAHPGACL